MTSEIPAKLERWLWRIDRIERGSAEHTRTQVLAGRVELELDRTAYPQAYAAHGDDFDRAIAALEMLATQQSRREDLLRVVATEKRARSAEVLESEETQSEFGRARASARRELEQIPTGLPPVLDAWNRRAVKAAHELFPMPAGEASRGETVLRADRTAHPTMYAPHWVARRLDRVLDMLSELATHERPGRYPRKENVKSLRRSI